MQRLEHLCVEKPLRVYRELTLVGDAARTQGAPQAPAREHKHLYGTGRGGAQAERRGEGCAGVERGWHGAV